MTSNASLNNSGESPTQGTNLVSAGAQSTSTGKATTVSANDTAKRQQSDGQKSHQTDEFATQSGHQTIQGGPNKTLPQQEVIQSSKYNRVFGQYDPNSKKLGEPQQEKTNQNIVDNNKSGAWQRDEDVIEATHEDKEQRRNSVPNRSEARPQTCLVLSQQTKTASVNDAAKKQQSNGQSDHKTIQQGRPNETLLQQSMLQSSKGRRVFGEDDRNSEKLGDPKKEKTKPNIDDYSKNGGHHHAGENVVIAVHVGTEHPQNSIPNESESRPEANLSPSRRAENQPQSNANTNLTGTRKTDESLSNQKTDNAVSSQNVSSPYKEKSDGNTEKNLMRENARDRVNERNNSNNQETEDEKIERNSHAQAQIKKPSKVENQQSSTDLPRENCSTDPLRDSGDTNVDNNSSSKETADQVLLRTKHHGIVILLTVFTAMHCITA